MTSLLYVDGSDTTPKDTQKKSKRKGRNKQETISVSQPEPEPVKTPIDLMKVGQHVSNTEKVHH